MTRTSTRSTGQRQTTGGRIAPFLRARILALPGVRATARAIRAWATPMGRALWKLERDQSEALMQPSIRTSRDRHPLIFRTVQQQLVEVDSPKVLSFGCSVGAEAFTLADYLPNAAIDAIDINPRCIEKARKAASREGIDRIAFSCANSPPFDARRYDAVFCLSVLRHGRLDAEQPSRSTHILPFGRFAAMVDALDQCVRVGGLLVLWGCNFRFSDTPTARNYQVIPVPGMRSQRNAFYGPDDRRMVGATYGDFIFQKQAEICAEAASKAARNANLG